MKRLTGRTMFAAIAAAIAAGQSGSACAGPIVYGFDSFSDGTVVSSQYAGLSFSQATILMAKGSLNDLAYPPHSLDGVVFDSGGPMTITFFSPVFRVGGYFTYSSGLTVSAYDADGVLLDTGIGAYAINLADGSGDPSSSPNEFLQVDSAEGRISYITLTAHADGSSFVLDDLSVEASVAIPEPSTIALIGIGLCAALRRRSRVEFNRNM